MVHTGRDGVDVERIVERTIALARIPAPPGQEDDRAALVADWWRRDGFDDVHVDAERNVWARAYGPADARTAVLLCAHLDTVFAAHELHEVTRTTDGLLLGRSVGDNSVAVAACSDVMGRVSAATEVAVWLVGTGGEEGLGNLRGIYHALQKPPLPVVGVIAVEGNYLGRVGVRGVASERWAVRITTEGGHSWERSDAPSAVHEGAGMVTRLTRPLPRTPRQTINVGEFHGGDSITSRGRQADLRIDMRSTDPAALVGLRHRLLDAAQAARDGGVSVALSQIGRRGGGSIARDHPLVKCAVASLEAIGREPEIVEVSTDANAAYDLGVPAITVGITDGAGQHSPDEWISIAPIASGVVAVADTINGYLSSLADGSHPSVAP